MNTKMQHDIKGENKMPRKALLVTHVSGFVPQFEMNNVRILQRLGYAGHYASNFHTPSYGTDNHRLDGTGIICHQIDFVRSPFDKRNFQVYRQMVELMRRGVGASGGTCDGERPGDLYGPWIPFF